MTKINNIKEKAEAKTAAKSKVKTKSEKNIASSEDMQVDRTIGQQLKAKRLKKDLKIDQVAQQLNLSTHAIEQIENDNYDDLPEMTYVRGYIVSYCRLLDLPSENVVSMLVSEGSTGVVSSSAYAQNSRISSRSRKSSKRPFLGKFLITVSLLGILGLIYMQYSGMLSEEGTVIKEADKVEAKSLVDEKITVSDKKSVAEVKAEDSSKEIVVSIETDSNTQSKSANTEEQSATEVANKGLLEMEFNSISWVDIKNSKKDRVIYQSFPRGEKHTVVTALPLDVFIDNAEGVTMRYEGKVIDLTNKIKEDGYVKFTLANEAQ